MKSRLVVLAVTAAGALFGAGGGVAAATPVATVDGEPIEQAEFDHWLAIALKSDTPTLDPPDYQSCVAATRKTVEPERAKKVTDRQLAQQCRDRYEQLRAQVLERRITSRWLAGEARLRGVTLTEEEVGKVAAEEKRRSFEQEADFQRYLADAGLTVEDYVQGIRSDLLTEKLREQVTAAAPPVSEQAIVRYYKANQKLFTSPEERAVRLVLTPTAAEAAQARAALAAGRSWRAVAKRWSIDHSTRRPGDQLPAQTAGALPRKLDEAVFAARKGRLSEPVKTQYGYYVFTVTRVGKARVQPLAQAREFIEYTLRFNQELDALNAWVEDFNARWRAKTVCAEGYAISSDCSNGPPDERMR
jgi:foldase protein PrsA